jgi:hypothetical protein
VDLLLKARFRDERGQVLAWAVLLLFVLVPVFLGYGWGLPQFLAARAQAQSAVDAAVGTAAQQAVPVLTLDVAYYDLNCVQDSTGDTACAQGPTRHAQVQVQGLGFDEGSPPAWQTAAGCTLTQAQVGQGGIPQSGRVCESWTLVGQPSWTYPDQGPGEPYSGLAADAAQQYLDTGMGGLPHQVDAFSTATDGSGTASMLATVTDIPGDPLRGLLGSRVTLTVAAQAQPRLAAVVPSSGDG